MDRILRQSLGFIYLILVILIGANGVKKAEAGNEQEKSEIVERVIKIEGSLEKPRILFILPKAEIWKKEIYKKSFINNILKPVYPESLTNKLDFGNAKK